jgi:hypothetical protein
VTAVARLADDGVAKNVATPVPKPDTPVLTGNPVQFVKVPLVGVPSRGVTSVGLVDRTLLPVPVLVVTPVPPDVTANVADKPAAVPVVFWLNVGQVNVPVEKLPDVGVPNTGVTSVGLVERTLFPDPVLVVTPVPPLATGKVPVTPVVRGKPVQLVSVPLVGVPSAGVTSVGLVERTTDPVPVLVVTPVPPEATARVADRPAAVPVVF